MFQFSLVCIILLTSLAWAARSADERLSEWRKNYAQSCPSPSNITIFQGAVTSQVNSLRYSYQASPLRWNSTLATNAATCASNHVASGSLSYCSSCGSGAAETSGINANPAPSQGARTLISAPVGGIKGYQTQTLGWYAAFLNPLGDGIECVDWNSPAYNPSCSHFTQLIWQSTTQFGCAYSNKTSTAFAEATGVGMHALSCCWWPAGNTPGLFPENVKQDTA